MDENMGCSSDISSSAWYLCLYGCRAVLVIIGEIKVSDKGMNPPEVRERIQNFMIRKGEDKDIVLPLFVAPSELWQMITVKQSLKVHPEGSVGNHTLKVLQNLRVINKVTLWSALLHDVGKSKVTKEINGKITAYGHEKESVIIANKIFLSNDYFNDIYNEALFCIEHHMRVKHIHEMRPAKRKKLVEHKHFNSLIELAYADSMGGLGDLTWYNWLKSNL